MTSHGKKRKKRSAKHDIDTKDDDVMVAGVIHISDQFELKHENPTSNAADRSTTEWTEEQFNNCQNEKQTNEDDKRYEVVLNITNPINYGFSIGFSLKKLMGWKIRVNMCFEV